MQVRSVAEVLHLSGFPFLRQVIGHLNMRDFFVNTPAHVTNFHFMFRLSMA